MSRTNARSLQKPRLVYQVVIERKPYLRRFRLSMFGFLAGVGAVFALTEASTRQLANPTLLNAGWLLAVIVAGLLFAHAVVNLARSLNRRDETLRVFDQGLSWTQNGEKQQLGWGRVQIFRESGRGLYISNRPLLQWGAHTLTLTDGQVLRLTPRYGNLRRLAAAIRPFVAEVTGAEMARALRDGDSVQLHPRLIVRPDGVQLGKKGIHWEDLDVRLKKGRLTLRGRTTDGRFKKIRTFPLHTVDNLGGFVELAATTIRNYQPERFKKKPVPET
jgi:hypothetical protein